MSEQFKMSIRSNPAFEMTLEVFDSTGTLVGYVMLQDVQATIAGHLRVTDAERSAALESMYPKRSHV